MMDAKDCNDAIERLPLYVGGDLDPEVQDAVARHLAACPGCRAEEARAAEARDALVRAFQGEVAGGGPNLWPGIRAALARDGVIRRSPRAGGPRRRVAQLLAAAAAAALIASALWRGGDPGPADPGPAPSDAVAGVVEAPLVVAPAAGADDAAARGQGLVPILDAGDRLSTQFGPDVGSYSLTSSPAVR